MFEGQYDQAPVYSVKATLPDGVEKGTINFTWYVNGVAQPVISIEAEAGVEVKNTIQPDTLLDKSYGVYPVYCVVSYTVSETGKDGKVSEKVYSNTSMTINFIVAKGINSNSFLTFSDVHETFTNIGKAVKNIMAMNNDGLIPGLVICTGDWANEHYMGGDETSTNYATTRDVYLKRLAAQVGKIDTVYVSGNHDNGNAAKDATIAAGLGAAADYNGAGVIFDSEVAAENGDSSKNTKDLIVYGINYENMAKDGGGYSYENIIPDLREYLEKLSDNYAGQMVVISAHAGLHKLDDWGGEAAYNTDQSDQMVSLLNEYAKTGMNIMFFFGHDHSKGESELILKPGDTITSTISFEDKTTSDQKVFFTYGHAGYITSNVGGKRRYTEVEWTDLEQPDAVISHTLSTMDKEGALTTDAGLSGEVGAFTDYQFLEKETSWKGDTGKGLTVRANGSIDVFAGVMVDGAVISDDDYAALKGSTIVTLSPAYLKTLANGIHKMKLLFTNGETEEVEFEVQNQEEPDKPEPKPEEPAPAMDQPDDKPAAAPAPANAPAGPSIPRTGDDSMQALWMLIMILSLGAVFVAVRKLVRNK